MARGRWEAVRNKGKARLQEESRGARPELRDWWRAVEVWLELEKV